MPTPRVLRCAFALFLLMALGPLLPSAGCSEPQGSLGQPCFPNDTCFKHLRCDASKRCVSGTPSAEVTPGDGGQGDKGEPGLGEACSESLPCGTIDGDGKRLVCDPTTRKCTPPCSAPSDCAKGWVCRVQTGVCEAAKVPDAPSCDRTCSSDDGCPGEQTCNAGCCRGNPHCTRDRDCSDAAPVCHLATGACVACLTSAHCQRSQERAVCRARRCHRVECTEASHCPNALPFCDLSNNTCKSLFCTKDEDCPDPERSRCDRSANGARGACRKGLCVPCTSDDECGDGREFCIGSDKGLKDGRRCLTSCTSDTECPDGFSCSDAVLKGFKLCFPRAGFCEDPCKKISCKAGETCVAGVCRSAAP